MTNRGLDTARTTGEPPTGDQQPGAERRAWRRPVLVELASALLVVGGILNLIISVDVLMRLAERGESIAAHTAITIALGIATLGLGLAIRYGRAWLIAVNVVAILGFLELISGSIVGLLFGTLDVAVVLALMRERPWFLWSAGERELAASERVAARRA